MKNFVLFFLSMSSQAFIFGQDDWKLPMVNDRIQMEFNSKHLEIGKSTLCEMYTSSNTMTELQKRIQALTTNGNIKFWSASSFAIGPLLWGADVSSGSQKMQFCTTAESDTLIGSLNMYINQANLLTSSRTGSVKCLYRIILNTNDYNIKFRGFEYTYYTKATLLKPSEMIVVKLEEEYDETNASKSDRAYWADIKMLVTWYHSTLEEILGSQASDFNFDD